jgi:biotin carboxylase
VSSQAAAEKPVVLLVGGGPFQLEILRAAQKHAEVAVLDGSPNAPGLALADYPRVVDIADAARVVRVARELRVSGVVTAASDVAVPAVSAVVRELGLPGLLPEVAMRCRDKLACFRVLIAKGHAVPQTRAVHDDTDGHEAHHAVIALGGYPAIVKPRSGGGGRGVVLVRERSQLCAAMACARRAYGPGQHGVLIQEFIAGRSVGVEAFFSNGELAEAFVLDDQFEQSYISPAGHALPSTLEPEIARKVIEHVAAFGRALGLRDGPANFDLRQLGERTVMLEVNPRLGGNSITDLVRAAYGVDLAEATVCAALGRDPRPILARTKLAPTAARLILKHAHGVAHMTDPTAEFRQHPDLLAMDLLVSDGALAHTRVDEWTILGRTMVRGKDSDSAARLAEQIASHVAASIQLS